MGNVMNEETPDERTMEWAVARADKIQKVTRAVCTTGQFIDGNRSVSRDGKNYVYTNGADIQTFDGPQEAIDAFMG